MRTWSSFTCQRSSFDVVVFTPTKLRVWPGSAGAGNNAATFLDIGLIRSAGMRLPEKGSRSIAVGQSPAGERIVYDALLTADIRQAGEVALQELRSRYGYQLVRGGRAPSQAVVEEIKECPVAAIVELRYQHRVAECRAKFVLDIFLPDRCKEASGVQLVIPEEIVCRAVELISPRSVW